MSKFNVGDKVRIIRSRRSPLMPGHITTLMDIPEHTGGHYRVTEGYFFDEVDLEHASDKLPAQTPIALVMPTGPGLASRANNGKIRPTLFPVVVYRECLKVLQFGANKYGDFNWQKGFKYRDCADSLERHWIDWKDGIDFDEETKLYHLAHVIINATFLLYYQITGKYKHLDNRVELNKGESSEP